MDKQSITPSTPQAISTTDDAELTLLLNGKPVRFSWKLTRLAILYMLPEWLRNSHADPPEPDATEKKANLGKHETVLLRSGFKNLARPFLPKLMKGLYGEQVKLPHGKDDVLPIIDLMIIDFALHQAYSHPIEITYDEDTGIVQNVRPGQRVVPTDHAGEPLGGPGTD